MALCYLARKIGVPALRRAPSAPRVATPRRLLCSSSHHQSAHNNGAIVGARKPLPDPDAEMQRVQAEFKAQCEALRKVIKGRAMHRRRLIWSGVAGAGLALVTIGYTTYEEKKRARYFRSIMNECDLDQ